MRSFPRKECGRFQSAQLALWALHALFIPMSYRGTLNLNPVNGVEITTRISKFLWMREVKSE